MSEFFLEFLQIIFPETEGKKLYNFCTLRWEQKYNQL